MAQVEVILGWRGRTVTDSDGDRIGKLDEIFVDRETGKPEFALVDVGPLGLRSRLVPLAGAASVDEAIKVPYSKDQIKEAPDIKTDGEPKPEDEAKLYRHYGLDYDEARADQPETGEGAEQAAEKTAIDTGMRSAPAGSEAGPSGDARSRKEEAERQGGGSEGGQMTGSEEELQAGTATRPRTRARLKKYVVTEDVDEAVPVKREEVHVERESVGGTEAETHVSEVSEQVRKERVEVERE
jgi:hypothetical protein